MEMAIPLLTMLAHDHLMHKVSIFVPSIHIQHMQYFTASLSLPYHLHVVISSSPRLP